MQPSSAKRHLRSSIQVRRVGRCFRSRGLGTVASRHAGVNSGEGLTAFGFDRWALRVRRIAVVAALAAGSASGAGLNAQQVIRLEQIARATSDRLLNELGVVADAVADPQGRVFILDETGPRIVVTDSHLRPLGYFGRRGSGPGEFREPVSIGILADGRVAVLDRALRRVTILAVRQGGRSLVPERTVETRIASESMCVLADDKLLVYGFSGAARLHVFDLDGRQLRSFAPGDSTRSPMARQLLAKGRIACDQTQDEVLVSSRFLPVVEAFRIGTGERLWVDTLGSPFRPIVVTDRGRSATVASGRAGHSLISSLFRANDYRVFQTAYASRQDGADVDTVVSYVYSRRLRAWMAPQFQAPIVFPLRGGRALSVRENDRLEIQISRLIIGRNRAAERSPPPDN